METRHWQGLAAAPTTLLMTIFMALLTVLSIGAAALPPKALAQSLEPDALPYVSTPVNTSSPRQPLTDYPYRTVGLFLADDRQPRYPHCVASLISPGLILTAASCVDTSDLASHRFVPGWEIGFAPFGIWQIEDIRIAEGYDPALEVSDDIAIARLETKTDLAGNEYRLGERIGWLRTGLRDDPDVTEQRYQMITMLDYYASAEGFIDPVPAFSFYGSGSMQKFDMLADFDFATATATVGPRDGQSESPFEFVAHGGAPWISDFDGNNAPWFAGSTSQIIAISGQRDDQVPLTTALLDQQNFEALRDSFCVEETLDCEVTRAQGRQPAIKIELEEPIQDGFYSGIGIIRGWAVYDLGIEEIWVTISSRGRKSLTLGAPYGSERTDVWRAYPEIPQSQNSGFGVAFNYSELLPRDYNITVWARSFTGEVNSRTVNFRVDGFHKPYIEPTDEVSLDEADVGASGDVLDIRGARLDGRKYELRLRWNPAIQDFDLEEITRCPVC